LEFGYRFFYYYKVNEKEKKNEKMEINTVRSSLTLPERSFLLSIKKGILQWDFLEIPGVENLPAIQWKLENIKHMEKKSIKLPLEN